jgi:hypothetical protein
MKMSLDEKIKSPFYYFNMAGILLRFFLGKCTENWTK